MKIDSAVMTNLPSNYREIIREFPNLIEPMATTILEADEAKQHPCALAMASIAAGRDVLAELWAPEFAIIALRMAIAGLVEANPELEELARDPEPEPRSGPLN